MEWANCAKPDKKQRRAFEILAATFVLTFHDDLGYRQLRALPGEESSIMQKEVAKLRKLSDETRRQRRQLICLLHGAGGCGKTTVIDLVLLYAKEFSDFVPDFVFTSNTIVVTAMSGVAATLLLGETAHRAMHLNNTKPLNHDHIEPWLETRMVIVDEISFADKRLILKWINSCERSSNSFTNAMETCMSSSPVIFDKWSLVVAKLYHLIVVSVKPSAIGLTALLN